MIVNVWFYLLLYQITTVPTQSVYICIHVSSFHEYVFSKFRWIHGEDVQVESQSALKRSQVSRSFHRSTSISCSFDLHQLCWETGAGTCQVLKSPSMMTDFLFLNASQRPKPSFVNMSSLNCHSLTNIASPDVKRGKACSSFLVQLKCSILLSQKWESMAIYLYKLI